MRVLVLGASGMLGHKLMQVLACRGSRVIAGVHRRSHDCDPVSGTMGLVDGTRTEDISSVVARLAIVLCPQTPGRNADRSVPYRAALRMAATAQHHFVRPVWASVLKHRFSTAFLWICQASADSCESELLRGEAVACDAAKPCLAISPVRMMGVLE